MIFLDTSAIYALADRSDPNHAIAAKKFDLASKSGEIFLVHNYILAESAALLQARLGLTAALLFLEDAKSFVVEWVNRELHEKAITELKKIGRRGVSFVDCISFIVMRKKGLKTVFAFDPDFQDQGFSLY